MWRSLTGSLAALRALSAPTLRTAPYSTTLRRVATVHVRCLCSGETSGATQERSGKESLPTPEEVLEAFDRTDAKRTLDEIVNEPSSAERLREDGLILPPMGDVYYKPPPSGPTPAQIKQQKMAQQSKSLREAKGKRDAKGRVYATGKRKSSVARVWVKEGTGQIEVNRALLDEYFRESHQQMAVRLPLELAQVADKFDVWCTVKGGGVKGQAEAVRHGIAIALQLYDPALRSTLKSALLLRRDDRVVERKKPGQKKARKKFQWVKR